MSAAFDPLRAGARAIFRKFVSDPTRRALGASRS